jgi:uncharacterized protein (TIGR00369 family)
MAVAILTVLPLTERVTTVDLTISYLRPLVTGRIRTTAHIIRAGKRIFSVAADVVSEDGNLAATALSTYIKLANH